MTHQVQYNFPTFEALLRKNMHLFLERCRRSNNAWLPALMQSDCLYSPLFFEHCNRILLCDWVLGHCSQSRIKGYGDPGQFLLEGPYDVIHDVNVCKSYVFADSQGSRLFFP